jgi:iterative type I PKS product template protein
MEILKPIIVPENRPETPQILHISAFADLAEGTVQIEYHTHTRDTNKKDLNAKCLVAYGDAKKWLSNWARTAYLVQNRIRDLESGLSNGATHRILRNMAYKLFSSLVYYGENFQGMQEVLLNSDDLESVASLNLYEANDSGSFFCSPFWIDSFAHLSGFIINTSNTADSLDVAYISHGWGSMRFAQVIDPKKSYRVHVKMHTLSKTIIAGDATIFQGNTMMGLIKGIKFQQVPRSLLNSLLPPVSTDRHVQPQNLLEVQETIKLQQTSNLSPISSANPVGPATSQTPAWNQAIEVIAHEIGIPTNELSEDTSFSAAGIDSLLSLTILLRIRELYQMALPPTLFEDYPTVGDLERYLRQLPVNVEQHMELSTTDSNLLSSAGDEPKFPSNPQAQISDLTLSILRSAVADQIGIEVNELLAAKDLSTLGMDSLMSLSIISTLREKLGISLSHDIINGESSMQSIERSLGLLPLNQVLRTEQQTHPVSKTGGTLSVLLQGNPKLASETLFLFPDGSGSAMSYARLPEVSPDLCILGLNSPLLRAGREVIMDLEELIVSWSAEIRSLQPRGPYILGGWSSGGYYAFEATKKLLQAGEIVDKLILIDSPPRNVYESMPPDVLDFVTEKRIMCDNGNPAPPQWLIEHFEVTLRAVDKYIPSAITSSHLPQTFIIWASDSISKDLNVTALGLDLNPKITQFLLQDKTDFQPFGWDRLLPGADIVVMKMPGNHFSIVRPPRVSF